MTTRFRCSFHRVIGEIADADDPRSAFAVLGRRQDLLLYQAPNRRFAHLEDGRRFFQSSFAPLSALGAQSRTEDKPRRQPEETPHPHESVRLASARSPAATAFVSVETRIFHAFERSAFQTRGTHAVGRHPRPADHAVPGAFATTRAFLERIPSNPCRGSPERQPRKPTSSLCRPSRTTSSSSVKARTTAST